MEQLTYFDILRDMTSDRPISIEGDISLLTQSLRSAIANDDVETVLDMWSYVNLHMVDDDTSLEYGFRTELIITIHGMIRDLGYIDKFISSISSRGDDHDVSHIRRTRHAAA